MGNKLFQQLSVSYIVKGLLEYLKHRFLFIHGNLIRLFLIMFRLTSQTTTLSTCLHRWGGLCASEMLVSLSPARGTL
jgi:hypothetical protein